MPFTRRLDFQPDEPTPSLPSRIRTGVIEIAKLRAFTFLCLFIRLNTIATVRQAVSRNAHALALGRRLRQGSVGARRRWKAARPRVRPGKYFVCPPLPPTFSHSLTAGVPISRFVSTAIRSGAYRNNYEAPDTIRGLIAGVVVPNLALRTRDVEAFEDTSFEYVRAELHVSEVATPRQAAADVVKAFGGIGSDSESAMIRVVL